MTELTGIITFLMTTLGTIVTTVTANPIMLVGVGLSVVGGAIVLFKKLT